MKKKVYIASDHAGFALKNKIVVKLQDLGFAVQDLGPASEDRADYPDFADKVCHALLKDPTAMGVLTCGSGQGMAMRANKYSHIRAALCWNSESAHLAREHNDANVLCMGARLLPEPLIFEMLNVFFQQEFAGGRHQDRVQKISAPTC